MLAVPFKYKKTLNRLAKGMQIQPEHCKYFKFLHNMQIYLEMNITEWVLHNTAITLDQMEQSKRLCEHKMKLCWLAL